jgi:ferredoxin
LSSLKKEIELFKLHVNFNGQSYTGEGRSDFTILENVEKMNLPIRSSCRKGKCGSCKITLIKGELDPLRNVNEDGYVFSCASILLSEAEILISYR